MITKTFLVEEFKRYTELDGDALNELRQELVARLTPHVGRLVSVTGYPLETEVRTILYDPDAEMLQRLVLPFTNNTTGVSRENPRQCVSVSNVELLRLNQPSEAISDVSLTVSALGFADPTPSAGLTRAEKLTYRLHDILSMELWLDDALDIAVPAVSGRYLP